MSSLLTALQTAGHALQGFEKAIGVVQTNVLNASTPGYARKQLQMSADTFDPAAGLYGGLETGDIESSRSVYAEQSVWHETQSVGYFDELYSALDPLQGVFNLTGTTGMASGLSGLTDAFSAWSQSPNDTTARQNVILAGRNLANQFQMAYEELAADGGSMARQVDSLTSKINTLADNIAQINNTIAKSSGNGNIDDSTLYSDLEELSGLVNVSYAKASDGTYTVLLAGQVPLVVGETTYHLATSSTPNSAGIPALDVSSTNGPITGLLTGGRLGAQLSAYNGTLTSLLGGATSSGSLNDLAASVVDAVNTILGGGMKADQTTPGSQLFANLPDGAVALGDQPATPLGVGETEVYTVNTASGTQTITLNGSAGNTVPAQLQNLNSQLAILGISARLDVNGQLQLSSKNAFSVSVAAAAGGGTGFISAAAASATNAGMYSKSLVVAPGAATVSTAKFTTGGTSFTMSFNGLPSTQAIADDINSQLAAHGVTGVTAVVDATSPTTIDFEGKTAFTFSGFTSSATPATDTVIPANNPNGSSAAPTSITAPAASVISLFTNASGIEVGADDLGAYDPTTDTANGICLKLAGLSSSKGTIGTSSNITFTDYLASVASELGAKISSADTSNQAQAQLLAQAKSLRSEVSGVSLDEEAAQLMAFQQSYTATSQVFKTVNEMLDTLMAIVQ